MFIGLTYGLLSPMLQVRVLPGALTNLLLGRAFPRVESDFGHCTTVVQLCEKMRRYAPLTRMSVAGWSHAKELDTRA